MRLGVGDVPIQNVTVGQNSAGGVLTPPDPFMLNEARALQARLRRRTGPSPHRATGPGRDVSVIGDREGVLRVARALLVQTAVTHAPDDVAIALGVPGEHIEEWEWAKWLPHVLDPHDTTAGGRAPHRTGPGQLGRLIGADLKRRASYAAEVRRGLSDGTRSRSPTGYWS